MWNLLYYFSYHIFILFSIYQWFKILLVWYLENSYPIPINTQYYGKIYIGHNLTKNDKLKLKLEIDKIAIESVSCIPKYSIMKGEEIEDKIFIIIYDYYHLPIAMNCMFSWNYKNRNIYHGGLFLVSNSYKNQGLQKYLNHFQKYVFLKNLPNLSLYVTDLGRSATGWKLLDTNSQYCYPSLLNKDKNQEFNKEAIKIAEVFYNTIAKKSCGVSTNSSYDKNTLCIKNSNDKEGGGFEELTQFEENRLSKDNRYNDKILELCPDVKDELIIIAKVDLLYLFKKMLF